MYLHHLSVILNISFPSQLSGPYLTFSHPQLVQLIRHYTWLFSIAYTSANICMSLTSMCFQPEVCCIYSVKSVMIHSTSSMSFLCFYNRLFYVVICQMAVVPYQQLIYFTGTWSSLRVHTYFGLWNWEEKLFYSMFYRSCGGVKKS